jgi:hypothetical protein
MGLIRLATYAIVGYAAYSVITGLMHSQSAGLMGQGQGQRRGRRTRGGEGAGGETGPAARMSGPAGERGGRVETTQGPEGGSTPHRVGRGVVGT